MISGIKGRRGKIDSTSNYPEEASNQKVLTGVGLSCEQLYFLEIALPRPAVTWWTINSARLEEIRNRPTPAAPRRVAAAGNAINFD